MNRHQKAKCARKGLRLNAPPERIMRDRRMRRRKMRERREMAGEAVEP
ncbi:MAG: hypothetical protein M0031_06185 [Thermaerobacter sp.]|nr:hypothetical protein [Thermaerobacter sp.]